MLNRNTFLYAFLKTNTLNFLDFTFKILHKFQFRSRRVVKLSPLLKPIAVKPHNLLFSAFKHPFHLVNPSPWPLFVSVSVWLTLITFVGIFHNNGVVFDVVFGFCCLLISVFYWWKDVISESTFEFSHTPQVRRGLLLGVGLFIISEIFLFFGFFWAFFHSSLVPSAALGGVWPPVIITVISPWKLPLVNTLTLIISGFTVTIAHRALKSVIFFDALSRYFLIQKICFWIFVTILFAIFFLFCQIFEYYFAEFRLSDTIYGTTFYTLTGLHGIHVLVGTIFLIVCFFRSIFLHFSNWKQIGLKSAIWYWHFVDVVWILLYFVIYIWGGSIVYM